MTIIKTKIQSTKSINLPKVLKKDIKKNNYDKVKWEINVINKNKRNKKVPSWKKRGNKHSPKVPLSKPQYRLLITLYQEFLEGDMSYSDFVAILKLNGIEIARVADWNENGELILDYDDLSEVPDTIELHDNSGHVKDFVQDIDKDQMASASGEIDGGDIEVEKVANAGSDSGSNGNANSHANGNANSHVNANSNANSNANAEVAA